MLTIILGISNTQFINPSYNSTIKYTNYTKFVKRGSFQGRATLKCSNFSRQTYLSIRPSWGLTKSSLNNSTAISRHKFTPIKDSSNYYSPSCGSTLSHKLVHHLITHPPSCGSYFKRHHPFITLAILEAYKSRLFLYQSSAILEAYHTHRANLSRHIRHP